MKSVTTKLEPQKTKKFLYGACAIALVGWFVFRCAAIGAENARAIFNPVRNALDIGAPVYVMEMRRTPGTLHEPIEIKNNRALISATRVGKLAPGQRVGAGEIISVSKNVDLNTGMHVVRTRGASDGLQYAEFQSDGYFVPLAAIDNNAVMVVDENSTATPRNITILRQDADFAMVDGLGDGDVVILSHVDAGDKVQIQK